MTDRFKVGDVVLCTDKFKYNYNLVGVILEDNISRTNTYTIDFDFHNNTRAGTKNNYHPERIRLYDLNKQKVQR